jgi:CheY-like chemotaxis protein
MLLQMLGGTVQVVHDGRSALSAIDAFRPGVVMLDLGMPDMDGYEVARRIRERPDSGGITLIALTGWGQDGDREVTRAAGFAHHIVKPAEIGALQTLLASLAK